MRPLGLGRAAFVLLAFLAAGHLSAQEPRPVRLLASHLRQPDGISLEFAWRFAPGDGPGREAPDHDDGAWRPLRPALEREALPPGGWPGTGWFRRHLLVDPVLQKLDPVTLRFESFGTADVYLDGRLVLSTTAPGANAETGWRRREARLIRLEGHEHVLAVRYSYPRGAASDRPEIGFRLSLADPGLASAVGTEAPWLVGVRGAAAALPLFFALLHLALFGFDRRARENLFYAVEMAAFTVIVIGEYRGDLLASDAQRQLLGRFVQGAPVVAILFGLLTYYALRTNPFPPTWKAFAASAVVLFPLVYAVPSLLKSCWTAYFVLVVLEVVRLERGGRVVEREGARFFLASFAVFGLTIVLQILVENGMLETVVGLRPVYILGILASAAGMSLYLARTLGRSRLLEAENRRKTRELEQARQVQMSMLPRELPAVRGLDVAVATYTAAEVGGDYYDVRVSARDESLLVAFGDATGHGLAAGILVTAAKALFTSLPVDGALPELLSGCDRVLRGMRLPHLQMCLTLARVSPRELAVVTAAMPPALVHRAATDRVEEVGAGGLPLGSRLATRHEERRVALAPGDTVLFASDGFPELLDREGRELGYPAAADAFREAARASDARSVVEGLARAATAFRGGRPQDDDITFLVARVDASAGGSRPSADR